MNAVLKRPSICTVNNLKHTINVKFDREVDQLNRLEVVDILNNSRFSY